MSRRLLVALGVYTPGLVAPLLTARTEGSGGVRALLRRILPGVFSPNAPLIAGLALGVLWIAAGYFLVRMPPTLEGRQGDEKT